jgi:arylsulfatase A-like enzyme
MKRSGGWAWAFLSILWATSAGAAGAERAAAPGAAGEAQRPNVILILADDLGYGDLGSYGQRHIKTPHLDRLAAEGMRFTSFYAGSPVCAPSRCVLLTGRHTGHAFIRNNRELKTEGQTPLPADTVTLATVLKQAGYRTGCVGKWGLGGPGSEGEPGDGRLGFDLFYGYLCQRKAHRHYPDHLWRNGEKIVLPENADNRRGAYAHDLLTNEAMEFVGKARPGEPFFLYLAYTIPHFDLDVPDDSIAPYAGQWDEPTLPMGNYRPQPRPRAAYAGMISRMDRDVGRLLAMLKKKNLDDDTLILFTSDNGATFLKGLDSAFFNSNGPLRGFKADLWEGGLRVPMIARWPGQIKAGSTSDLPAAFWDVMPTLAELADQQPPRPTDGVTLLPTLLGRAAEQPPRDYLYWEFPAGPGWQAVRIGDWKGVRQNVRQKPNGPIQLFDLKSDRGETTNRAAAHPDVVKRMAEIMKTARTESTEFPLYGPAK